MIEQIQKLEQIRAALLMIGVDLPEFYMRKTWCITVDLREIIDGMEQEVEGSKAKG